MEQFTDYKSQLERQHREYVTLCVEKDTLLQNGEDTTNRTAPQGYSWIDYWRAMSGNHRSELSCSSCGKIIFADDVPEIMRKVYRMIGGSVHDHVAHGGHLMVEASPTGDYAGGFYIAPLCPQCNAQRGKKIKIRKGTLLCREITVP